MDTNTSCIPCPTKAAGLSAGMFVGWSGLGLRRTRGQGDSFMPLPDTAAQSNEGPIVERPPSLIRCLVWKLDTDARRCA